MSRLAATALRRGAVLIGLAAASLALSTGPSPAQLPTAEQPFNRVTLHQGPGLTGASKSWDLPADQLFLAVPYAGETFAGPSPTVQVGAELGVALFQSPFFTSADDTCDYALGSEEVPRRWWISDKVRVLPERPSTEPFEAALEGQTVGSLIIYRRLVGPPPGIQLLEQRRYVNWSCGRPTKARGYKRLFIPAAAPPNRSACFDLDTTLRFGAGKQVKLDFTAASFLLLMLPRDLHDSHRSVDHSFTVGLFDDRSCQGESVTFAVPDSASREIDLAAVDFNRKARSVLLRYDGGALDEVLTVSNTAEVELAEPLVVAAPEEAAPAAAAVATVAVTESVEVSEEESLAETVAEEVPAAEADQQAAEAEAQADQALAEQDAGIGAAAIPAAESAPPEAVSEAPEADAWSEDAETAARDLSGEEPAGAETVAAGSAAPGVTAAPAAETEPGTLFDTGSESAGEQALAGENQAGSAQVGLVTAPEAPQSPAAPATEEAAAPAAGVAFKLPLLQGYRLHSCLEGQRGCGEPAADAWCKARGFTKAAGFQIDENIGSLFPTLAIGNLELCTNFVCDGFKEITCAP